MIIAIEGVPQTGKCILLDKLCDALDLYGWRYVDLIETENATKEFQRWIESERESLILLHGSHLCLVDRKERVGEHSLGGISLVEWSAIDDAMARNGAHLILLQDDPLEIEKRMVRLNRPASRDQIGLRQNYLNQLFDSSTIPTKGRYTLRQFVAEGGKTTDQFDALVKTIEARKRS